MNKKASVQTMILALSMSISVTTHANTLAFWNDNDQAKVVARSMDLNIAESPQLRASPRGITRIGDLSKNHLSWQAQYGSVVVTAFKTNATTDGMNDQGLSVHSIAFDKANYGERDPVLPTLSNTLWVQYMLDNFKDVNEALASIDKYQIVSTPIAENELGLHLALQDSTGDAAIIEFIDGKPVVHHGKEFNVVTNQTPHQQQLENLSQYQAFGGEMPMPGDFDPVSRYIRATAYLKTLPKPIDAAEAISGIESVIRTTMVPFGTSAWPTRWVAVSDLSNNIYYFSSTSSPNVIWVDLKKLNLKPNGRIAILDPNQPNLSGDVSKNFKAAKL